LIHDVDHPGVPNSTLIGEGSRLAALYNNKSIAEQNSVDLAWDLLMQDEYLELRRTIYATGEELQHFRTLIINIVMATE
jgi:3'5'-cyclic nucleotide phosphodiesterase